MQQNKRGVNTVVNARLADGPMPSATDNRLVYAIFQAAVFHRRRGTLDGQGLHVTGRGPAWSARDAWVHGRSFGYNVRRHVRHLTV